MKIVLIRAIARDQKIITQPLGLMYISSYLKNKGYTDVSIIDMALTSLKDLTQIINEKKPDITGIGGLISQYKEIHEIAAIVKKTYRSSFIVAGGHYSTTMPYQCINDENIDAIVCGEGEKSFYELTDKIFKNDDISQIKGVWIKDKGKIKANGYSDIEETLDNFPLPDRNIPLKSYSQFIPHTPLLYGSEYADILTSRGCPFKCIFCHSLNSKKFRFHSPERVFEEIIEINKKHGIKNIEIIDDIFNYDIKRTKEIFKLIIDSNIKVNLYICGIRMDIIDDETVELMKLAGVRYIGCGLETGSEKLQGTIKKHINLKKFKINSDKLVKKRIFITAGLIFGFKEETFKTFKDTILYTLKLNIHSVMSATLRIYPGTELSIKENIIIPPEKDRGVYTEYFSSQIPLKRTLKASFFKYILNLLFYLNPFRIYIILRDLPLKNFKILKMLFVKFIFRILPLK